MKLTLYIVLILVVFIGCKNNPSEKNSKEVIPIIDSLNDVSAVLFDLENETNQSKSNENYGKTGEEDKGFSEEENDYVKKDTCDLADNIRELLFDFLNKSKTKEIYSKGFVQVLQKNNNMAGTDCFFPRNNEESILLYDFTNKLSKLVENNLNATKLIFSLMLYNSNNIEYSEYGQDIIPSIAINNTENFIRALSEENIQNQNILIENLDYIKSMVEVETLKGNLSNINEEKLKPTIKKVESFLNDTFYQ
jgi:hypothetical protein